MHKRYIEHAYDVRNSVQSIKNQQCFRRRIDVRSERGQVSSICPVLICYPSLGEIYEFKLPNFYSVQDETSANH